jgi:hypothetical protein
MRWYESLNKHRQLLATGIFVLLFLYAVVAIEKPEDQVKFLWAGVPSAVFVVLVFSIIADHFRRGTSIRDIDDIQQALIADLSYVQIPFILRISQGPDPLHDQGDEYSLPAIVEGREFWDWNFYAPPPDPTSLRLTLKEVRDLYCVEARRPETSSIGLVSEVFRSRRGSILVIGTIRSGANPTFEKSPWLLAKPDLLSLRPTRIYTYQYCEVDEELELRRARVMQQTRDVEATWKDIKKFLATQKFNQMDRTTRWTFPTASDWSAKTGEDIVTAAESAFAEREVLNVWRLRWEDLRRFRLHPWQKFLFVVGLLLSPLTFLNDAFVNVPLAAAATWVVTSTTAADEVWVFPSAYLATNIVGLGLIAIPVATAVKGPLLEWRLASEDLWRPVVLALFVGLLTAVLIFR